MDMKSAGYWHAEDDGRVVCELCPQGCCVAEGGIGLCGVRGVEKGQLVARGYGRVSSASNDPIEKKPLYHFFPGTEVFSIGGWGCNLSCSFCQNWSISQRVEGGECSNVEDIVSKALSFGSVGIAYTYNEPVVGIEFVMDCARAAKEAGLMNILVTNGFLNSGPASDLLPLIDALNIDIKSMREEFYTNRCGGRLQPVLDFAVQSKEVGCHVEITNLLIEGENDADTNITALAQWVAANLGDKTPLHLSAYYPRYKLQAAPTAVRTLIRARKVCTEMLAYVYCGNVRTDEGQNTYCAGCGTELVSRSGYVTKTDGMSGGLCSECGCEVDFRV